MCCNNIRPSLSIAPPIEELHSRGSEEDNDKGFGGNTGPLPIKKAPRELPKEPPTPSSSRSSGKGNTSSRVKQKGLIQDFFSGCVCEERDHTWFQQQAQLTSLAHKFKSSWAKDHQIMELSEKLEKKHNELYQAQLENVRLQQALELRDLSSKDPSLLKNLAHTSNRLGLHLPYSHHSNRASSEKCVKLE
jgi:hypothetical protein